LCDEWLEFLLSLPQSREGGRGRRAAPTNLVSLEKKEKREGVAQWLSRCTAPTLKREEGEGRVRRTIGAVAPFLAQQLGLGKEGGKYRRRSAPTPHLESHERGKREKKEADRWWRSQATERKRITWFATRSEFCVRLPGPRKRGGERMRYQAPSNL